jgi:signal transduction histidine kinase
MDESRRGKGCHAGVLAAAPALPTLGTGVRHEGPVDYASAAGRRRTSPGRTGNGKVQSHVSVRIAVLVWTLALAAAGGVVAVVLGSDHASGRISILALTVPTGLAFIASGLIARTRRPDNRSGLLLMAAGFASFVAALKTADAAVMFSLGHALQWAYFGFVVHVVLAFPSGRLEAGADRWLVAAGYLLSFAMLPVLMTFGEAHVECDRGPCPPNVLSVGGGDDVAAVLDQVHLWIALSVALAVLVRLAGRWRRAASPMRRAMAPVFASFGVLIVILAAQHVAEASHPEALDAMNWLLLGALLAVPLAFLLGLFRTRLGRHVERLVVELASARPGTVRDALARALADPTLELAYRVGDRDAFVDIEGRPAPLPAVGSGRAATFVAGEGGTVAAIVHDESLAGDPLLGPVTAAAALALENERLQAELRARLQDLRASRARLVRAGDEARQRLERNLHDGAQQRLVALSLSLRLAQAKFVSDPAGAHKLITAAAAEAANATAELRELARGLHPAILSDRGLGPALETLAARAPCPVELDLRASDRFPAPVEVAAYYVVAEALTNVAKYAEATAARVCVDERDGMAVVEIADDGVGGADVSAGSGLRGLRDRVEALDGRLTVRSSPGVGTRIVAEIPVRFTVTADVAEAVTASDRG